MSLTVKVWCPADESEPEGVFNKKSCPDCPLGWFNNESPEVAAELYALERASFVVKKGVSQCQVDNAPGRTRFSGIIHVLDDQGKLHKFKGRAGMELVAHVESLP
jgi:hypothetical protein